MNNRTRWFGIIGYPIRHSLSPLMHNAAFEALGLDYCYIPLTVEPPRVRSAVKALRWLQFRGFNVTIPHKQRIMAYLDRLTPEAKLIGAVNTVDIHQGRLIGHNTDGRGFLRSVMEVTGQTVTDKRVLLLGAGGAARAVAFQLILENVATMFISNRSSARAHGLARDLGRSPNRCFLSVLPWTEKALKKAVQETDIIINATSVGMNPSDPPLLASDVLKSRHIVCDLVYKPATTGLLRQAQAAGATVITGLGMLVHQGALSFEIWTGQRPPVDVMREAVGRAIMG
ncbi:MAG TPA: shikimate dehydrogenase [Nitrospiria bacterium]|nr:shikimate dehydrogenase [Nitrospiria bacterium]